MLPELLLGQSVMDDLVGRVSGSTLMTRLRHGTHVTDVEPRTGGEVPQLRDGQVGEGVEAAQVLVRLADHAMSLCDDGGRSNDRGGWFAPRIACSGVAVRIRWRAGCTRE
jgi:hypothetical protein